DLTRAVPQATDAEGRVEEEATGGGVRTAELALQRVVDEDDGLVQVVQEVAHAVAAVFRYDPAVAFGHRPDKGGVDEQVEVENLPFHRLQRIVGLVEFGSGDWIGRRRRAGGNRQHHPEHRA